MGLPIKETIYTWRHSKHKLPLSSETESHLIFQECRLKGKLLFQYRHQRLALFFPSCFLSTQTHAHTHTGTISLQSKSSPGVPAEKKKKKEKETKEPRLPLGDGLSQMSLSLAPPKND